jgi:branched-chain amino acid transport system substrate-binding protein
MKVKLTCALLGAALLSVARFAQANENPIRVGLMLPYLGSFSPFGNAIENGFKLYVHEQGGKLVGRELAYYKVDDESNITKATDNANRLIQNDKVDLIIGTVDSGVAVSLVYTAKETDTTLIVPNAGAIPLPTFCAAPIF